MASGRRPNRAATIVPGHEASSVSPFIHERSVKTQRDLGQYMTPEHLTQQMCDQVRRPAAAWSVFDPACGNGNLLVAAARRMLVAGVTNLRSRIMGLDIDPQMVATTRARLADLMGCGTDEVRVYEADFLTVSAIPLLREWSQFAFDYNLVLSNPPYGRSREYQFFLRCSEISPSHSELIFLIPLAFLDRIHGVHAIPFEGRPMAVTTGHAIIRHEVGATFRIASVRDHQRNMRQFNVLTGVKLYELGAGQPPQTEAVLGAKPYSSRQRQPGWWPCVRTGDVHPFVVELGRLWVDYGPHLAHPKDLNRFRGPRLFVRRVPVWRTRHLAAAYIDELALCAGDVLIVRHTTDDPSLLKGLCAFLNGPLAANAIFEHRPSVRYRTSFPKISAKDLNYLLDTVVPQDRALFDLAAADTITPLSAQLTIPHNATTH